MTGGTTAACFLPTEPDGKSNGRKREGERSSVLSLGRDFAGVMGERRLQLLIPLLFYSGLQRAFIWYASLHTLLRGELQSSEASLVSMATDFEDSIHVTSFYSE